MQTKSNAEPIIKTSSELQKIFSKTVLKPFTEKWMAEVKKYHAEYKIQPSAQKNDIEIYERQIEILLQKGTLVLDGIQNISNSVKNAKTVDELSKQENQFKIVGTVTRAFAKFYLNYLEAFIALKFSTIEKVGISVFGATYNFQSVSERRKDAKLKKEALQKQIDQFDKQPPTPKLR